MIHSKKNVFDLVIQNNCYENVFLKRMVLIQNACSFFLFVIGGGKSP